MNTNIPREYCQQVMVHENESVCRDGLPDSNDPTKRSNRNTCAQISSDEFARDF